MKLLTPCMRWFNRTASLSLHSMPLILILGRLSICAVHAADPAVARFTGTMMLQDGKLTARIEAAPLRRVMEEVSKLSGARIRWLSLAGAEPVSAEFTDLPISEALRRILGEHDFALFEPTAKGKASPPQIWIYPKRRAAEQSAHRQDQEAMPPSSSNIEPTVELPSGEPDLDLLIRIATNDPERSDRLDAIAQLWGYARKDPLAETTLLQLASSDSDPQVREAATQVLQVLEGAYFGKAAQTGGVRGTVADAEDLAR